MDGMQAYGAGKAGGDFDPVTFFQQPHAILRIVNWLFSLVIFGCIANEGYTNKPSEEREFCIFNQSAAACSYAVVMGTMCLISASALLALDARFSQISSVKNRKKAVLGDLGLSAFWAFMWFVGFCLMANQWQNSRPEDNPLKEGGDAARAAITFSFFSIFTWGAQSFLAFQRYKLGADSAIFSQDYAEPGQDAGQGPYSAFPGDTVDSPPGGAAADGTGDSPVGYQRQEY